MLVTIEVTQEHIDRGKHGSCFRCPVAQAIAVHLAPKAYSMIGPAGIYLYRAEPGSPDLVIMLPLPVINFITRFDYHSRVRPLSFDLDIPAEYLVGADHA